MASRPSRKLETFLVTTPSVGSERHIPIVCRMNQGTRFLFTKDIEVSTASAGDLAFDCTLMYRAKGA